MPRQNKKGGSNRASYTQLFDYPLSPCYKPEGKPEIFKAGWHAGGNGRAAFSKMFDAPLSQCYKPEGKPEIFKAGWHAGGNGNAKFACNTEPSVRQMGVYNQPLNPDMTASEKAWSARYSCAGTAASGNTQVGGGVLRNLRDLKSYMRENEKNNYAVIVLGTYLRGNYKIALFHFPRRQQAYSVSVEVEGENKNNKGVLKFEGFSTHSLVTAEEVLELLRRYKLKSIQIRGHMDKRTETIAGRNRAVYYDKERNREFYRERRDGKLVKKYLREKKSNKNE
jgi:hypothetical protein